VIERPPVAPAAAVRKLAGCVLTTFWLLAERRIHLPKGYVGLQLNFADGTASKVYRETVVDRPATADPAVLVVGFRLRAVRGRLAHALFRFESLFNTPLFVGFPGFVSKLWVAHDSNEVYRGVYEWDGVTLAEDYVRTLWRVLALVCVPGSIHYEIAPGLTREELLGDPATLEGRTPAQMRDALRLTATERLPA
jgi:hypothetical protein